MDLPLCRSFRVLERRRRFALATPLNSIILVMAVSLFPFAKASSPQEFLQDQMQLSPDQISDVQNGKAVAKILRSSKPSDIYVFGAVYIHAEPAAYIRFMRDMSRLKKVSGYLGVGEFSTPPTFDDMAGLSVDKADIEDLKNCRPGSCDVQLPKESMEAARGSIDWQSPNIAEQVNKLAKLGILRLLNDYRKSGDAALLAYRDKRDPVPVGEQFQSLLSRVEFFPEYLPDLNDYLLHYPQSKPEGAQDFFYWEKVNFGLKPTIRVNHGIVYRVAGPRHRIYVIAIKQLYAAHYFQTAVDLSFCVQKSNAAAEDGFYLITIKASRQAGLTGVKGGVVRHAAIRKTRSSLENALNSIRENLEHRTELPYEKSSRGVCQSEERQNVSRGETCD